MVLQHKLTLYVLVSLVKVSNSAVQTAVSLVGCVAGGGYLAGNGCDVFLTVSYYAMVILIPPKKDDHHFMQQLSAKYYCLVSLFGISDTASAADDAVGETQVHGGGETTLR